MKLSRHNNIMTKLELAQLFTSLNQHALAIWMHHYSHVPQHNNYACISFMHTISCNTALCHTNYQMFTLMVDCALFVD